MIVESIIIGTLLIYAGAYLIDRKKKATEWDLNCNRMSKESSVVLASIGHRNLGLLRNNS